MIRAVVQRSSTNIAVVLELSGFQERQDGVLTSRADHFFGRPERIVTAAWLAASIRSVDPDGLALVAGDGAHGVLRRCLTGCQRHGGAKHTGED